MSAIQEIFAEYARMREHGLDSKSALRSLKPYTDQLSASDKSELAQTLRLWEAGETKAPPSGGMGTATMTVEKVTPEKEKPTGIRALGSHNSTHTAGGNKERKGVIRSLAPKKDAEAEDDWVVCTRCGKKSLRREVFCHSCGTILDTKSSSEITRHFTVNPDDPTTNADYFGPDSVLILQIRGMPDQYELSPQTMGHEMVIGRATPGSAMMPDIDLSEAQGASLGVSRLHLSLRYESSTNVVKVHDLGSANGSYINGQKLHPQEVRVLRHGDVLRLGKLIMEVRVSHPNSNR